MVYVVPVGSGILAVTVTVSPNSHPLASFIYTVWVPAGNQADLLLP